MVLFFRFFRLPCFSDLRKGHKRVTKGEITPTNFGDIVENWKVKTTVSGNIVRGKCKKPHSRQIRA